jgi:hypothetical protein
MEQDRASSLQFHHPKLARQATDESANGLNLIAKTTTRAGLNVKAAIDENHYQTALKITDEQLAGLRLTPAQFHGDWNYLIKPR